MKKQELYLPGLFWLVTIIFISGTAFMAGDKQSKQKSAVGGEMTWTVRTVPNGANFSPKHVFAIWIEDENGFVKTRKAMANQRKQYLYTWKAASNYNVVDAITGPTMTSHQTHTVTWDFTDLDGNIVPDGDYTVFTEYTSAHEQGPLTSTTFTKGPDSVLINPPDETYFKDMELSFVPYMSDFTMDTLSICQWGTVTFTDQSVNATSWDWNFGQGAAPATSSTQGPHTVYYTTPGLKTVTLTINGNLTETKTDIISVGVNPSAAFDFSGLDFDVSFTNTSVDASSYNWDFGDGSTSTEENPVHTYSQAGTYTIVLTAYNNLCSNSASHEVSLPMVGIDEFNSTSGISIFPNPGNGLFTIQSKAGQIISGIEIFNDDGRLIQKEKFSRQDQLNTFRMDRAEKGVYFVKIIGKEKTIMKKLIVL